MHSIDLSEVLGQSKSSESDTSILCSELYKAFFLYSLIGKSMLYFSMLLLGGSSYI